MSITSITLNGLEIGVSSHYGCANEMVAALKSGAETTPVLVERPGTYPVLIRRQMVAKSIPGQIYLLAGSLATRRADLATLEAAATSALEVPLTWVEDSVTRTYTVSCSGAVVNPQFTRVAIAMVAPNPVAA